MSNTDVLQPRWAPSPPTPFRSKWRSTRQVNVRLSAADHATVEQAAFRSGFSTTEFARVGVMLLATGYPSLPEDVHGWLVQLANANDLHGDPNAALVALVRDLRQRYPVARRLAGATDPKRFTDARRRGLGVR